MLQVGITTTNQPVLDGVFELVDTYGVPLEVVLSEFRHRGLAPAWDVFMMEASKAGWSDRNTDSRIEAACADVYGAEHTAEVMRRVALVRRTLC